jgi:hypothetical protein
MTGHGRHGMNVAFMAHGYTGPTGPCCMTIPVKKKHKPGVDTWMRTSDFFHEDTPWYDMINAPSMDGSYSPIDERIRLSTKNQKRRTTSRSHQNYQPSFTVIITIIYLP